MRWPRIPIGLAESRSPRVAASKVKWAARVEVAFDDRKQACVSITWGLSLHCPLPYLSGEAVLHRFDGSVHGIAVMGSHARATGATVKDSNGKPPYRHWHTVCAACGKVTLARPCKVPGDIDPIEHNPVIRCQHCEDTRQYLDKDCFLAPLSVAGSSDKSGGTVAVVAGLIAAVKLARVESIELQNRSPRVRSAISDSITLARMVIDASNAK